MLDQERVDREEEALRQEVGKLDDRQREAFYARVKPRLRDPDTYAALNWFFLTGIHHFYIGRWVRGAINLLGFIVGFALMFSGSPGIGVLLIVAITALELWALFRSQIIVQDRNNRIGREELAKL